MFWARRVVLGLLGLCLLGSPLLRAQAPPWTAFDFFGLTGGLADGLESTAIQPTEASDLQNVVFSTGGAIRRRDGFTRINASANPSTTASTTGLVFYKQTDGTRFLVRLVNDGGSDLIQKMDYGSGTTGPDGTWDDITGAVSVSIGTDDQASFTFALNRLLIEDGVNTTIPAQWTGSGNASALTNAPNSQFVVFHKLHVFAGGNNTNPSRIAFSALCAVDVSCLTSWTSTDVIDVETNDGQIVRWLASGLDALYIWKDTSIWRLTGTDRDTWKLDLMVKDVGTLAGPSVQFINNKFVFLTSNCDVGVYDGGINVELISTKIQGTLDGLNLDRCDEAVSAQFDGDYYVSVSDGTSSTHNLLLIFDTFHQAWTKFSGMNANALATYEIGTLEQAITFGDYAGFVNRYPNGNTDAGSAIDSFYQSGDLRFAQLPHEKIFRLARIFANQTGSGNNLTFSRRIDFIGTGTSTTISLAGTGSLYDTAVFDTDAYADLTTVIGRVEINEPGDFLRWRVADNSTSPAWTVRGIQLWVEETNRIGGIF